MKRLSFAIVAALVAACAETTGPGASARYLFLSGVWQASGNTPGGSLIKIATSAGGGRINGIGVAYGFQNVDSLEISGEYAADGSFGLSIVYAGGQSATYSGQVQGTGALAGSWTDWSTGASYNTTFTRLPVPPCADSVPLLGTYDPVAPGFIVQFQDTVNAAAEAARLGTVYGFTPMHVYEAAIKGFAADVPLATATVLRCEPKVKQIEYDGAATTQ